MTRRTRRRLLIVAILICAMVVSWRFSRRSGSPSLNLPYVAWKMGIGDFHPRYAWMIGQDREYWEKYLGRQLEDFQKELDTPFYDGSTFPLSSYRGKYWYYNSQRSPQSRYLFFDGDQKAWGWCVIVVDGRISGYGLAKD